MGVYIDGISKQTVEALLVQYPYYLDKLIEIDLVRCGECKQLDQTKWCDLFLHYMNEDDFCSYGERRADDNKRRSV